MNTAYVKIWGELAGAVAWSPQSGLATFEYHPSFLKTGWEIAPLQMPLNSNKSIFSFPALMAPNPNEFNTFKGLPGLLADILPDRYGHELINLWLAQNGRAPNSMNPVEMLCFIGTRGMGALEFEPVSIAEGRRTFAVEIDSLVDYAKKILQRKKSFVTRLQAQDEQAIKEILQIGTSAGGARPKAIIAYNEKTKEVRSGQTHAPSGFEHWMIKLDGVSEAGLGNTKGFGRVEMAYYHMALECGINMMPSRLLEENGRAHFMTKRFDREGAYTKHHIQTFCAMKHFDYNQINSFSYEQLFQTMRELHLPYPDAEQMFRRMVFNVLARNCDDRTKNFAFRLKKNSDWELAPAYDVCHAYQPGHPWVSRHALSINGKRNKISKSDLMTLGQSINIKKSKEIIEQVNDVIGQWKKFANETGVSPKLMKAIESTLIHFK